MATNEGVEVSQSPSATRSRPSPADQKAVAGLPARLVEVWAAHDADGFGELFTEDGTLVLPGVYVAGRDEIAAFMRNAFEGPYKGTRVTGAPVNVRFLGPDVALLITEGGVIAAGRTELADADAIRASWLTVRTDGGWRLAAYQNSPRDAR
ncbi:SgcJ/EcaC family oxidoreductase [Actinomadura logoneensis]|uniref:SgcJ/EcaC family oxidoreductase n=1 Tax=Actinomadura logoneensis TaxID=2293572 RepID=A0A372JG84_9ACTN|nr:SgcJ/EcaC family oxidoreductase [Actinomadura logoneensis]